MINRRKHEHSAADRSRCNSGRECPTLWLWGETARGEREHHESRTEGDESAAGDLRLRAAANTASTNTSPKTKPAAIEARTISPM